MLKKIIRDKIEDKIGTLTEREKAIINALSEEIEKLSKTNHDKAKKAER